ncbi:MAG: AbrB/MazE/SpoVT family DNA-binding domain-containing protein [Desulfovermiculus sp.]
MLVTIDKRGSINLPTSVRKDLGISPGTHLELTIEPGGALTLYPVEIYRSVQLSDAGLAKIQEARASDTSQLPEWFDQELAHAESDTK